MPLPLEAISNDGEITFYKRGIITKNGGASPSAFAGNLLRVSEQIVDYAVAAKQEGSELLVVTGFHGYFGSSKAPGSFDRPFDKEDLGVTAAQFGMFQKLVEAKQGAISLKLTLQDLSSEEILQLVERGHVFFAWCWADDRVKGTIEIANLKASQTQKQQGEQD